MRTNEASAATAHIDGVTVAITHTDSVSKQAFVATSILAFVAAILTVGIQAADFF